MSNAAKLAVPGSGDDGKAQVYNEGDDDYDLVDVATAAELAAHLGDTTDAHDASAISFSATGTIAGTDVQTAVAEVATDAASALSAHEADTTSVHGITNTANLVTTSTALGGVLGGTVGAATFAADMATQAELDAHTGDTSDAHDASAISVADSGGNYTATDVEGVLAEIAPQLGGGGGGNVATDTIWNAKGDLAVGTGSDTASRLAVGSNGHVLTADSGEATGVKWAAATGSFDPMAADAWFAAQFWS